VPGIRFAVPADDALDRVAFAYSPLQEAVLSLHVLVAPKHHALQHEWVREMRRLPAGLKRRIAEFGFAYRWTMPGFVTASPEAEFSDFEQDLSELAGHEPQTLAFDFLRPLYDHAGRRDTALLTDYWDAAFSGEWSRLEPRLTDAVAQAGREIAVHGLYSLVRGLSPRLRVDPEGEDFGLDLPHDHCVEVTEERKLVLVPSAFVWPHVRVNCDEPWPLTLVYPAPFVIDAARPRIPSPDLVQVLDALGNATRLHALKLVTERPRSTQELARLVGLTQAGVSKHLQKLAAAGLVSTRREGYYVLYSADAERLRPLSGTLIEYLAPKS
jgi:DNA-binding transcriptional ArsR family regulator